MIMAQLRCLAVACVGLMLMSGSAHAVINAKSPKYAALMVDADSGEVFFARNADAKRYPASLTKMMTLYLTFEALSKGDLKLTDKMPVSARAAMQPQTNISLRKGQTIPVETAIKALVVRSANDVAVVFAEHLGGTEWDFAIKMTNKARALGMKNTVFRNPHGLPDVKQFTTARDMATLGIALRRDFPQWFPYFKTMAFMWNGVNYTTHNRVMQRYHGVDGIKTGYINMSGFNLVSSIKRDGHTLVGVVLGGQTAPDRDQHMMALLDKTFATIAERGDQPRLVAEAAPTPSPKPSWSEVKEKPALFTMKHRVESAPLNAAEPPAGAQGSAEKAAPAPVSASAARLRDRMDHEHAASTETAKPNDRSWFDFSFNSKPKATGNTLEYQLASLSEAPAPAALAAKGQWGIQVGAFADQTSALQAAAKAVGQARDYLKDSQVAVVGGAAAGMHRARLANLSEFQAKNACKAVVAQQGQCFVYRVDSGI